MIKWYILTMKKINNNNNNLDVHVHDVVHFFFSTYGTLSYTNGAFQLRCWLKLCISVMTVAQMVHFSCDVCTNGAFQV